MNSLPEMDSTSGGSRISQTGGWTPTLDFGRKNPIFGKIFDENYMKMKEI